MDVIWLTQTLIFSCYDRLPHKCTLAKLNALHILTVIYTDDKHHVFLIVFCLELGEEDGYETVTVAESTHRAHAKNFDLVVPLLPHPLLVRSGAALLHYLLTWRNSSVEQHSQRYRVTEVRSGYKSPKFYHVRH